MIARLEPKHWTVIVAYLASTAVAIGGAAHWGDLLTPAAVSGFILQLSVLLTALFVGAPPNPNWTPEDHPGRRANDPASDQTRRMVM